MAGSAAAVSGSDQFQDRRQRFARRRHCFENHRGGLCSFFASSIEYRESGGWTGDPKFEIRSGLILDSQFGREVGGLSAILIGVNQEVARGHGDRRFLLVRSGGIVCALPANQVRRIVRGLICHPVPGGKPHLLGLAQYGGEPLAVLDILTLVTGSAPRANNRATVILGRERGGAHTVLGLAVDEALRVAAMSEFSNIEPGEGSLLDGTATFDRGAVKLLDTSVLFADEWPPTEDSHV